MTAVHGKRAMTELAQAAPREEQTQASPAQARLVLWLMGSAVAVMTGAGVVLWLTFGPAIFVSMLNAAVNCF
ncbi:MAG: hypothetical protein FJX29_00665 [Alphaproteobacteria bacterium]|nr:hypothetical protein [Alphaproteobacteria bacterium]